MTRQGYLERVVQENLLRHAILDISLDNDYMDWTPKVKATRARQQMGLHQTGKFLHSKGNHQQSKKATYPMGEYICT